MDFSENKKAQGATEYLLMLAAVLVVVAAAVYYVTQSAGGPVIAYQAENNGNDVTISIQSGTSPSPMTTEWDWIVIDDSGEGVASGTWNTGEAKDLSVGDEISVINDLGASGDIAATGDTFKIRVGGSVFEAQVM